MGLRLWRDAIAHRTERDFESVEAIHFHVSIFNSKLQHTIENTYIHSIGNLISCLIWCIFPGHDFDIERDGAAPASQEEKRVWWWMGKRGGARRH